MKCPGCGAAMETKRQNHRYVECGLASVTLEKVETHQCPGCGERAVTVPRISQLHQVIALGVSQQAARLRAPELRFLRKSLGWSAADFARTLGVDPATVSRWENDREPMGGASERLLRLAVLRDRPVEEYPTERLAEVARAGAAPRRFSIKVTKSGWELDE